MADFKPPLTCLPMTGFAELFFPFALWWGYYDGIDIDQVSRRRLESLRGKRAILCPNHSSGHDPGIVFSLEEVLDERFCFVAAREIFDWWHGLLGWLIQRIGAMSVKRSVADRAMISCVQRLMLKNDRKLVIFPEGDISYRNDCLLPIEEGLTALFLRTAAAVYREHPNEPLYVVPIALIYRYVQDISANLHNALVRIELTFDLNEHEGTLESRFERARRMILKRMPPRMREQRRARALASFQEATDYTWETLAAGVDLIERALYTRVTQKGHRRVRVSVGEPIDVVALLKGREHRHEVARELAMAIEDQLRQLLGISTAFARIVRAG